MTTLGEPEGAAEAQHAPPVSVLVADTQRLFAEALGVALRRRRRYHVIEDHPATGAHCVEASIRHRPDVVLLDYWMPGMNGLATTRMILARAPGVKVILLSSYHVGPRQVHDTAAAGATGLLRKNVSLDLVEEGIRLALGSTPSTTARHGPSRSVLEQSEVLEERWKRLMTLTPREVEVLQLMSHGHQTREEVASELGLAVGTLKNYLQRILKKTETNNPLEALTLARHYGLVRELGPPGS